MQLRVVHVNYSDKQGGAAKAAFRLVMGLRKVHIDAGMLVIKKVTSDADIHQIQINPVSINRKEKLNFQKIQKYYIDSNRTNLSNTLFSLGYPGIEIQRHQQIAEANLINLHWVSTMLSPVTLEKLFSIGMPIVWTLHDERAYTGGAHYAGGTDQHVTFMDRSDLLQSDPCGLTQAIIKDSSELFARHPEVVFVSPSKWLAREARRSAALRDRDIAVIPNSIETATYYPEEKRSARESLGISKDGVKILFASENGWEIRKGFAYLIMALERLVRDYPDLIATKKVQLLVLGDPHEQLSRIKVDNKLLGYIGDDELLRKVYSAADILVLPALEDNLPNMMLEAMACGTPIVGFDTGGIPDVVKNGLNGLLYPKKDAGGLADGLAKLIRNTRLRNAFSESSSELILREYSIEVQGQRYRDLYLSMLQTGQKHEQNHTEPKCAENYQMAIHMQYIFKRVLAESNRRMRKELLRRLASKISRFSNYAFASSAKDSKDKR